MCGIVGAVVAPSSGINVVPILIEGLKKLEYRGYDSAGLAIEKEDGIRRIRAVGRLQSWSRSLQTRPQPWALPIPAGQRMGV